MFATALQETIALLFNTVRSQLTVSWWGVGSNRLSFFFSAHQKQTPPTSQRCLLAETVTLPKIRTQFQQYHNKLQPSNDLPTTHRRNPSLPLRLNLRHPPPPPHPPNPPPRPPTTTNHKSPKHHHPRRHIPPSHHYHHHHKRESNIPQRPGGRGGGYPGSNQQSERCGEGVGGCGEEFGGAGGGDWGVGGGGEEVGGCC